jgi:hypothetical protein
LGRNLIGPIGPLLAQRHRSVGSDLLLAFDRPDDDQGFGPIVGVPLPFRAISNPGHSCLAVPAGQPLTLTSSCNSSSSWLASSTNAPPAQGGERGK